MNKKMTLLALAGMTLSLCSCTQSIQGTIIFELNGGSFVDPTFNTTRLTGEAGTRIELAIPDAYKEGYYFVGWREIDSNGNYREINPQVDSETGETYYLYPYGTDTLYAYFEPLETITFDLTDATDRNGVLIEPSENDGSYADGVLSGYANKSIPSSDHLPTASGDHLYFSSWYIDYPLIETTDENNSTHYVLDTSQPRGQYPFIEQFEGRMYFPLLTDGESLVLRALWEEYPTITVHFNLDGIEDYTFQAPRNGLIADQLEEMMYEELGLDITADDDYYTLSHEGVTYRFDGFYLDEDLTKQFGLNSSISSADVDLYLKWSNQIQVTLDYAGGTYQGEDSYTFSAFAGDTLEYYDVADVIPSKADADFLYFSLDGEEFDMTYDTLPYHDVTLVAQYEDHPTMTISFVYPESYVGERVEDRSAIFEQGADISDFINSALASMTDESMQLGILYTLDESGDKIDYSTYVMPDEDIIVYVDVLYRPEITLVSLIGDGDSYDELADLRTSIYLGTEMDEDENWNNISLTDETVFSVSDRSFQIPDSYEAPDGTIYLYDGIYADEAMSEEIYLPYSLELSSTNRVEATLYRRLTKAVILSFYDYATDESLGLSLPVLSDRYLSDYEVELLELLGEYEGLWIEDESGQLVPLTTFLPSSDSVIYVER